MKVAKPFHPARATWLIRKPLCWFREPFNGVSHLAGVFLSVAAVCMLLFVARGQLSLLLGCSLYGASLVTLYTASTLYHSLRVNPSAYEWLGRLDYIAIFLLIAGSFAPLCLVTLRGPVGWRLLAAEYAIALAGILGVLIWKRFPHGLRIVLYFFMGALVFPVLPSLQAALSTSALAWLTAGLIIYSVGAAILALEQPSLWPGNNCAHGVWHVFVLAGSTCHFVFVFCFIARPG